MIRRFLVAVGASLATLAHAEPSLQLPYEDRGVCPFECCTYREWTVEANVTLHRDRNRSSPAVFSLKSGERVLGETGVVVTNEPGRVSVLRKTELDVHSGRSISVKPGDVIRTLHYIGEGNWLAWFQGDLLSLDLPNSPYGVDEASLTEQTDFRVESEPVVTWWVLVRNARGQVGWTDKPEAFGNKDACG